MPRTSIKESTVHASRQSKKRRKKIFTTKRRKKRQVSTSSYWKWCERSSVMKPGPGNGWELVTCCTYYTDVTPEQEEILQTCIKKIDKRNEKDTNSFKTPTMIPFFLSGPNPSYAQWSFQKCYESDEVIEQRIQNSDSRYTDFHGHGGSLKEQDAEIKALVQLSGQELFDKWRTNRTLV